MSDKTAIEWTDATWNPVRGCSRASHGCGGANHQGGCYAEKIAARFSDPGQPFHGFAERTAHGGRWTGKLALVDDMLTVPLRWRKPRRIFVNSMSDLFHENLPDEAIDKVFAVMALAPQHTFQVLTKRADRMLAYVSAVVADRQRFTNWAAHGAEVARDIGKAAEVPPRWPLPNVWLGVSVEDQERADARIPDLLATPAAVRFLSCEPLLGPVDLTRIPSPVVTPEDEGFYHSALERGDIHYRDGTPDFLTGRSIVDAVDGPLMERIDWVIAGGESGPRARPSHPDWFRALRDQCLAADIPFFFKQWGEFAPRFDHKLQPRVQPWSGVDQTAVAEGRATIQQATVRVGKKAAGATLDGREWREVPDWSRS